MTSSIDRLRHVISLGHSSATLASLPLLCVYEFVAQLVWRCAEKNNM
jgi:hypothetical protein